MKRGMEPFLVLNRTISSKSAGIAIPRMFLFGSQKITKWEPYGNVLCLLDKFIACSILCCSVSNVYLFLLGMQLK